MTPEQLDEVEKLAEAATPGLWRAEADAAFIRAMREYALPLVKAVREAWAQHERNRAEWDATVVRLTREVFSIAEERDEARAEVERLRDIVEVNDRRLAAVWDESRAEVERLRAELRKVTP